MTNATPSLREQVLTTLPDAQDATEENWLVVFTPAGCPILIDVDPGDDRVYRIETPRTRKGRAKAGERYNLVEAPLRDAKLFV